MNLLAGVVATVLVFGVIGIGLWWLAGPAQRLTGSGRDMGSGGDASSADSHHMHP
jgi:hypothetical protein